MNDPRRLDYIRKAVAAGQHESTEVGVWNGDDVEFLLEEIDRAEAYAESLNDACVREQAANLRLRQWAAAVVHRLAFQDSTPLTTVKTTITQVRGEASEVAQGRHA